MTEIRDERKTAGGPSRDGLSDPHYRSLVKSPGLIISRVRWKESDLLIGATKDLAVPARAALMRCRKGLDDYIGRFPVFRDSLFPREAEEGAPEIVGEMTEAARSCGVGPMAAVAGAVAGCVGRELGRLSPEIIVENGGDIYIHCRRERTIAVYPGETHSLWKKLGILVKPEDTPLGVATSSGTVGPSLSWGKADAVVVLAENPALADAAATALANRIYSPEKAVWEAAMGHFRKISGIVGSLVIIADRTMAWGKLELVGLT